MRLVEVIAGMTRAEWFDFVIDGLNGIIVNPKATKKDVERSQFLIGCAFGYETYVDENYNQKSVEYAQRRRAKRKQLVDDLTHAEWVIIKNEFNHACAYCGEVKPLAREHVIPLAKGGGYTFTNIVPACKTCNSSKKDIDMVTWFRKQPFYNYIREHLIMIHTGSAAT